jgi:hypothetical protein
MYTFTKGNKEITTTMKFISLPLITGLVKIKGFDVRTDSRIRLN